MIYNFVVSVRILWTPISIVLADYITISDKPYLITIKSVIQDLNIAVNKMHKPLAKVVKSPFLDQVLGFSAQCEYIMDMILGLLCYCRHSSVTFEAAEVDFLLIFKVIIQKMQKHIQRFVI